MVKPTSKLSSFMASSSLLLIPAIAATKCPTTVQDNPTPSSTLLPYKLAALFEILLAGAAGIAVPLAAGKKVRALNPDGDVFFMIKAFAAGVILATGFVHILPDAFESFASPCLAGSAWGEFPFAGFVAMAASLGTMVVDTAAAGYYRRVHFGGKGKGGGVTVVDGDDEESGGEHGGHLHVHTHATHGHAHGETVVPVVAEEEELAGLDLIRHRVTSQVLEVGVMVHSVIIGVTLGASGSLITVKPLAAALSFHQFFEGMGLAGCISQAKFKLQTMVTMAIFFSLTTPLGIAIGIGISNIYSGSSPTALIVQGILQAASAGILIYMALVDLLAADFKNPRVQKSPTLQLGSNISLLLGAGCMSVLAKWA